VCPSVQEDDRAWFALLCDRYRNNWEAAIEQELADAPGSDSKEIAKIIAENASHEVKRMEAELDRMLVRTTIIVAATTLLFAVYAFKASIAFGVLLATVAFIAALIPMCPPILRAWRDAYVPRHAWTLLATNHFKRWAIDCFLADRRTGIITNYKRAHTIAVPMLALAACVTAAVLTAGVFK